MSELSLLERQLKQEQKKEGDTVDMTATTMNTKHDTVVSYSEIHAQNYN